MSGLEARLRKLESINLENISDDARIIRPMSNTERAARVLWLFSHPDKCDPNTLARVTEILSKHLFLKVYKNYDLVDNKDQGESVTHRVQDSRVRREAKQGINRTDQG